MEESYNLAKSIGEILMDKKAKNPIILDVRDMTLVSDYFVIATGTSITHVQALAEHLMTSLKKTEGFSPLHKEGVETGNWVLIDYNSVLVHIFQEETREFYNLERLWGEAEEIHLTEESEI